ncbi:MAG: hypothetical protein PF501_09870 [Salinisphaera sp.]|jgi:hypothetical protein|nr:hypothetical protein [Salinisphaera sp.]
MDRLKEELAWLRVVFSLGVVIDVTLFGWIAQNHSSADALLLFFGAGLALLLTVMIGWTSRAMLKRLDKLE